MSKVPAHDRRFVTGVFHGAGAKDRGRVPARFTLPALWATTGPFEVVDQAGKHGKPGAFEVAAATGERPGLVDVEPDDRPITGVV